MGFFNALSGVIKEAGKFATKHPKIAEAVVTGAKAVGTFIATNVGKVIGWAKNKLVGDIKENKITKEDNQQMAEKMAEKGSFNETHATTEEIIDFDKILD